MKKKRGFHDLAIISLLLFNWTHCACADDLSDVPGVTSTIYDRICGVWEEPSLSKASGRVTKQFSWGTGGVIPNQGLIIELGKPRAYIRFIGELLTVTSLDATDSQIHIYVTDTAIGGTGAFVEVLMKFHPDGAALVDFRRADGTWYGAFLYERLYGPGVK